MHSEAPSEEAQTLARSLCDAVRAQRRAPVNEPEREVELIAVLRLRILEGQRALPQHGDRALGVHPFERRRQPREAA